MDASASPVTSSAASLSSANEQDEHVKARRAGDKAEESRAVSASEHSSSEDVGGSESPGGSGGWTALGMMKDRATMAKNQLAPQLLNMKERTSKRLGKYQPSINKVRSSASAAAIMGRERVAPALSLVKEGSTQGWSMLKTKLASAAPVAGKIQTMGMQVVTEMMAETPIEVMFVDNPAEANCRFLLEYKAPLPTASTGKGGMTLLRLSRAISTASTSSLSSLSRAESTASNSEPSAAQLCFGKSYILGTILVFCGDIQTLGRVASVSRACHKFISTESRLWKFCVRYGEISEGTRLGFWEKIAGVRKIRESSEFDFDVYLQMALSKGDSTELILTDVRRTYGRVAPHKRSANDRDEVVEDTEEALITQLSDILHALAGRFPDVGYCQGMDYIAAHVLDHVKKYTEAKQAARQAMHSRVFTRVVVETDDHDDDEEDEDVSSPARTAASAATRVEVETAFWMLVGLFENYGLRQMFSPGLDRLHLNCFQFQRLFEIGMPALAEHFDKEKVMVEMFIVGWFQTLFLYLNVLPRETLDRIWDIFLFENNWKIMLRVALALLQLSEEHILGKRIDEVMQFLNTFPDKWDEILAPELLIEHALAIKVTNSVLNKLQKQYARQKRSSPVRR